MPLKYIEVSIENEKYSETETICIPLSISLIDIYIHKIPVHLQPNPLAGAGIINKIMDACICSINTEYGVNNEMYVETIAI